MSQQLSNQSLCGQSFKRRDLAGADFRRKDIRLCDFSYANLDKTDFSEVITGQFYQGSLFIGVIFGVIIFVLGCFSSPRNYFSLLLNSLSASALAFTLSVLSVGKDSLQDFWHPTKFLINLTTALFTGGIAWIIFYDSLPKAFLKGDIATGIFSGIFAIFLIWLTYILLRRSFNTLVNATGTVFTGARLANANFAGALLRNCDFTKATLDYVNWTGATFKRCQFSDNSNLKDPKVRHLCTSRRSEIEKDFSSADLSKLNLNRSDLHGTNLNFAILNGANLRNADLREANLSNALAITADFTGANLSGACIANWAITPETNFTDVVCTHIFIDFDKKERKPASGSFEQGDFAKLVTQSNNTLDFLFRNGIDPQAFDFALQQLKTQYPEADISVRSIENLGNGFQQVKLNKSINAPTAEMHAVGSKAYEEMHRELEDARLLIWELKQKLDRIDLDNKVQRHELEKRIAGLEGQLKERPTIQDMLQHIDNIRPNQTINQYGQGDNFAGDEVEGHKIG
jgi:uncharacterized protein YjbI with pentapeptide repeats